MENRSGLVVVPSTRDEANELVARFHRHHPRVLGHRFAIALQADGELVGAAIVSRPVSRMLDADRFTAEVVRLVVKEGVPNGCSKLYRAAVRAWKEQGGRRLVTYTLATEPGTSLRAAGFRFMGEAGGGSWSRVGRARQEQGADREEAPLGVECMSSTPRRLQCRGCGTTEGVAEYDVWPGVTRDLCGDCYSADQEATVQW